LLFFQTTDIDFKNKTSKGLQLGFFTIQQGKGKK